VKFEAKNVVLKVGI